MSVGPDPFKAPLPLMVKFWAGPQSHEYRYIKRSLTSLLRSGLPDNVRIILIDDQSSDTRVLDFVGQLVAAHTGVELWRNPERMGPNTGHAYNFPLVADRHPTAKLFMLCDDDVIYHPGWLQRLIRVWQEATAVGLNGVFTALNVPARPAFDAVTLPTSEVLLKQRQMALNWLLPRDVYDQVGPFRDTGVAYDTDYTDRMIALQLPVICLKPSYVQNIGYFGAYQNSDLLTAHDYVGRRDLWLRGRDAAFATRRAVLRFADTPLGRLAKPYVKAARRRLLG